MSDYRFPIINDNYITPVQVDSVINISSIRDTLKFTNGTDGFLITKPQTITGALLIRKRCVKQLTRFFSYCIIFCALR